MMLMSKDEHPKSKPQGQACGGEGVSEETIDAVDVAEAYSPPRLATEAHRFGLSPGSSLDLTGHDEEGRPWDFSKPEMRAKGRKRFHDEKPKVLMVSTMCRDWSQMMRVNWERMPPEEKAKRLQEAREHLGFVRTLCRDQHRRGDYYVHEHPAQADSWKESTIIQLQKETEGFYII